MYRCPQELIVESDGPVRIVTLNNPEHRNAFNDDLHDGFVALWSQIADDPDVRAVVLTGAGKAFSAGGNIPGFIRDYNSLDHRRRSLRKAKRLVDELVNFHLPIVGAVNGPAVGLGCTVAVLCDILYMADTAYIADTHVNIGLVAGDGGAAMWPLMMSLLRAKEFLFTGDKIPASLAVELGLANRVVPAEALLGEATALAHRLAAQPPQALQETKRAVNVWLAQAAASVLPFALASEGESFASDEVRETIAKFSKNDAQ